MSTTIEDSHRDRLKNGAHFVLLIVLVTAALLRLPGLNHLPPPLNQDEASRLYDAWSLLETGADRHGDAWPMFLMSFGEGDYTASLTTILTIPFVAMFGPTQWAVRLPDALCGVVTIWLLFLLIRRMIGAGAGVAAALILTLDPWHLSLCRTGHESGYAPFLLAGALLAASRAGLFCEVKVEHHQREPATWHPAGYAALAGMFFGLHTWVYPATRLFTPLFLAALLCVFGPLWLRNRARLGRIVATAILGLVAGTAPIWFTAIQHPERIAARAGVTLWSQANLESSPLWLFLRNYAANLSPVHQFIRFDEMSGMAIDGVGQHLLVTAPLWAIGLIVTASRCRESAWSRLLIAWFLLYPIPAAICSDWNPHPLRTVGGMILYPIIAATGWSWLASRLSKAARKRVLAFGLFAIVINAAGFVYIYSSRMPRTLEDGYQTGLVRAMQFVGERKERSDFVLVTRRFTQPYIYALLYASILPRELPSLPKISGDDLKGFHQVNRIGKFFFPPNRPEQTPELAQQFQQAFAALPVDAEGWVIELAGKFPEGELVATFANGRGPRVEVRRWQRGTSTTSQRGE